MKDSVLRDKSKAFAKEIVFLCRKMKENRVEGALIGQLLRSGTSVGANIHEAQYAQGTKTWEDVKTVFVNRWKEEMR